MLQEVTRLADVWALDRSFLSSASKVPRELGCYPANISLSSVTPDTLHPKFENCINLEYLYVKTKSQKRYENIQGNIYITGLVKDLSINSKLKIIEKIDRFDYKNRISLHRKTKVGEIVAKYISDFT